MRKGTRLAGSTSAVGVGGQVDVWAWCSEGRAHHRAGRHHTGREITPQRQHELARHRYDGDTSDASLDVAHPLAEPAAEFAVGLMAEPQPGDLDRHLASAAVAGFADALFAHAVATVVGRSRQPDIAADLAAGCANTL